MGLPYDMDHNSIVLPQRDCPVLISSGEYLVKFSAIPGKTSAEHNNLEALPKGAPALYSLSSGTWRMHQWVKNAVTLASGCHAAEDDYWSSNTHGAHSIVSLHLCILAALHVSQIQQEMRRAVNVYWVFWAGHHVLMIVIRRLQDGNKNSSIFISSCQKGVNCFQLRNVHVVYVWLICIVQIYVDSHPPPLWALTLRSNVMFEIQDILALFQPLPVIMVLLTTLVNQRAFNGRFTGQQNHCLILEINILDILAILPDRMVKGNVVGH